MKLNKVHWDWNSSAFCLACFFAGWLGACNLNEPGKNGLADISLDSTFMATPGVDRVVVSILSPSEDTLDAKAYEGPPPSTNKPILKNVPIGVHPGDNYTVVVIGYQGTQPVAGLRIEVLSNKISAKTPFVPAIPDDTTDVPTVPDSWILGNPNPLTLLLGDNPISLLASPEPAEADPAHSWQSSDSGVVAIGMGGGGKATVIPVSSGLAELRVVSTRNPDIFAVLSVRVLAAGDSTLPIGVEILTGSRLTLSVGDADFALTAQILPLSAAQELSWISSHPEIVSVGGSGLISPLSLGKAWIKAVAVENRNLQDSIEIQIVENNPVTSFRLNPERARLFLGGESLRLTPEIAPEVAGREAEYASRSPQVASVGEDGTVRALMEGVALIQANPIGWPDRIALCTVTVVRDVPVLDAGPDRSVKVGDTVSWSLNVTQEYGAVASLKWDLNNDSLWDDSVAAAEANPVRGYPEKGEFTAAFYVRDSEGNEVTLTRRIIVGGAGPFVDIRFPGRDTLVNTPQLVVRYTVDAAEKTKSVTLTEGPNSIVITETNADGIGRDSVRITLDTQAPRVKITSPDNGFVTNLRTLAIGWTVDDIPQISQPSVSLQSGENKIVRTAMDSAGNVGSDTITVHHDTEKPMPPVFNAVTTPTSNASPTWSWASGGGGNGIFKSSLDNPDSTAAVSDTSKQRQGTNLVEGPHVLYVWERDAAGNWSNPANQEIFVDRNNPILAVSGGNSKQVSSTTVTLSGTVGDGGGSGVEELSLSGAATGNGAVSVSGGAWSKGFTVNAKTTQVVLTATDRVGRQSAVTVTITLELPIPQVTITWPSVDGYVTSQGTLNIKYRIDNGTEQSESKTLVDGNNSVTIVGPANTSGERDTATRILVYRRNVVFVRDGSTGGDGTSWERAYGEVHEALASLEGKSGAYSVWVGAGEYQGFWIKRSETSVIGGFAADGQPASTESRDLSRDVSRVVESDGGGHISISGEAPSTCRNAVLDGFRIFEANTQVLSFSWQENSLVRNCWFENNHHLGGGAGLIAVASGSARFEKVYVRDNFVSGYSCIYSFSGGRLDIYDSEIINNQLDNGVANWGSAGILNEGGGPMTIRRTKLHSNYGGALSSNEIRDYQAFVHSSSIDIDSCTIQGMRAGLYPNAPSEAIQFGSSNIPY